MEQNDFQVIQQNWKALQKQAENDNGLVGALAGHATDRNHAALWEALTKLYGKEPTEVSEEEFLCRDLVNAFTALAGKEMAEKLPDMIALRLEGQFSGSPWRRSYRSQYFAFYAAQIIELLCQLIRLTCCPGTIKEWLTHTKTIYGNYAYPLALEIRRGNGEIISLLHEAMMGDNTKITLTCYMIDAIVISGHEGLLEDLLKLLLAARQQEGLRQQILEAADRGTVKVLIRILKVCIDENLFRYSSAIRAFDTWTGMGYGDAKPSAIQKYAELAYECLTDEAKRREYYKSRNNVEAYFSLWAQGCHEFTTTLDMVPHLLEDPSHYRQVLGWLFVTRTDSSRYQMAMASRYLHERDEELLAWIVQNLSQTWSLYKTNWNASRSTAGRCVSNPDFPDSKEERKRLFYQLKAVAEFIGNKKQTFTGNPFDFVSVTLESQKVHAPQSCLD